MKQIIFISLIAVIFGVSTFAQKVKPKTPAFPADIAGWTSEDSDKILDNPIIVTRLKKLLGRKNYADFRENWETLNPIVKEGNLLFSSGCLIHGCLHAESAIAIDLVNNRIHAAIYTQPKLRFFNEKGGKTPKSITDWAKRLKPIQ